MTEDFKRKLTAILSADVEGYSRLMGDDEDSTVRTLTSYRNLMSSLIERHHGQVVDSPGDNILAEFESVRDAVLCAVEIQEEIKVRNTDLPDNRKMQFRIGINLGDIIKDEGRIYGDGVNVAARIESLADAGGICLSRSAYDQVKKKLNYAYEHLGEYEVKNIDEPVSVYKVLMVSKTADKVAGEKNINVGKPVIKNISIIIIVIIAGLLVWRLYSNQRIVTKPESIELEQVTTPEIKEAPKTIAVLPFENISPDKDQDYFVDGLSEQIINDLTKISNLNVTSRTSSFVFKGSDKTAKEIAEILEREYILEGSVRKAGNALKITTQLIRASDDSHIWSETYDRELEDIFKIQEDIANNVAKKLKLTLEAFQLQGGTENIDAYELYLIAAGQAGQLNFDQALKSLDAVIKLDSKFALAWALKGMCHLIRINIRMGSEITTTDQSSSEINAALEAAVRAMEHEPNLGQAYLLLGAVNYWKGKFVEAEKAYQKGMALTTENYGLFALPAHYLSVGYFEKVREILEKERQSGPLSPNGHAIYMISSGFFDGIERAKEEYKIGKEKFGDQWSLGDVWIMNLRVGTKDNFTINEIPEILKDNQIYSLAIKHIESPKEGIEELRRFYETNEENRTALLLWAGYFGDPEFAIKIYEERTRLSPAGIYHIWLPVFKEVRQLSRFKELVKEMGLVDYWKEYGWPDLCQPVGDDDFECN